MISKRELFSISLGGLGSSMHMDKGSTAFAAEAKQCDEQCLQPYVADSNAVDVISFGAADGKESTDAIQNALNYSIENGLNLYLPLGRYLISPRELRILDFGKFSRRVCLTIQGKLNVFGPGTLVVAPPGPVDQPVHALHVENSQGTSLERLDIRPMTGQKHEAQIIGIVFHRSYGCTVSKSNIHECDGGIHVYNSSGILIDSCSSRTSVAREASKRSHIAAYASDNCVIKDCSTWGATLDGDLGVFGARSKGNKILGNVLDAAPIDSQLGEPTFNDGQGIFVDSGQSDVLVSSNCVRGYYYGIDVKTEVGGVHVSNNLVESCLYGIAVRNGENPQPVSSVYVVGNRIKPNRYRGRTNLPGVRAGDYSGVGILVRGFDVGPVVIDNNIIQDDLYLERTRGVSFEHDPRRSDENSSKDWERDWCGILLDAYGRSQSGEVSITRNILRSTASLKQVAFVENGGPLLVLRGGDKMKVFVEGNRVDSSQRAPASAVVIAGEWDAVIKSNTITSSSTEVGCIASMKCKSILFEGNYLEGSGDLIEARAQETYITGNQIRMRTGWVCRIFDNPVGSVSRNSVRCISGHLIEFDRSNLPATKLTIEMNIALFSGSFAISKGYSSMLSNTNSLQRVILD